MKKKSIAVFPCDDSHIVFAPYAWNRSGRGESARAEATMPGAYFRIICHGSTTIGVRIDGLANESCPGKSMPVVTYSVDDGPFHSIQLSSAGDMYILPVAAGLSKTKPHRLALHFRASDLQQNRWKTSTAHLRIAGIALDASGTLLPCPIHPKSAVAFGDSIIEGVGAEGLFTSWNDISVNNACVTWFPILCNALGCEYGQLGTGGLGVSNAALEIPPLTLSWCNYDADHSRLTDGRLKPEPDYVFCCLGTNDPGLDITGDYKSWLMVAREACPNARFFCIVPPLGIQKHEIEAAVRGRNQAGDRNVYSIDVASVVNGFREGQATLLAPDGVHPSIYGHAMLASAVGVQVASILCKS